MAPFSPWWDSGRAGLTIAGVLPYPFRRRQFGEAPRPFVAFAATSRRQAIRLYRAQNTVWAWLGIAAVLSAAEYFDRPHLGVVLVTGVPAFDVIRSVMFAVGGSLITSGVWFVRRAFEVLGHAFFATGALLNAVATTTLPGNQAVQLVLLVGVAAASLWRAYFIVRWIATDGSPRV